LTGETVSGAQNGDAGVLADTTRAPALKGCSGVPDIVFAACNQGKFYWQNDRAGQITYFIVTVTFFVQCKDCPGMKPLKTVERQQCRLSRRPLKKRGSGL
jgi:hypothetical protein